VIKEDEEVTRLDSKLNVPVLVTAAVRDPIGVTRFAEHMRGLADDLMIVEMDAKH